MNLQQIRAALVITLLACILSARSEPTNAPPQVHQLPTHKVMLEDWVLRTAAEDDTEYTGIFTELGLKPAEQAQFKSQLAELHRKAIAAGEPMQELLEARIAYDREIHKAMGDKNYQHYRDYEETKPARREYDLIQDFARKSNNLAMDPAFYDKIIQLIRDSKATTTENWHRPYDPRPHPEVGQQLSLIFMNQRLGQFRSASSNLVSVLPKSGLPDNYQRLLTDYCAHKLTEMEEQITQCSLPEEEQRRRQQLEMEREIEEHRLKRGANPANSLF